MPTLVKRFNLTPEVENYDEVIKYGELMLKVLNEYMHHDGSIDINDIKFMQHQLEIQINYMLDINEDLPKHHKCDYTITTLYDLRFALYNVLEELEKPMEYPKTFYIIDYENLTTMRDLYREQDKALTVISDAQAYLNYLQGDNPDYAKEIGLK